MADITTLQSGDVVDDGLVNWRGDQNNIPEGGQSVHKTSSVQLAPLGARRVVGDRVFRYAQIGAVAAGAGDVMQAPAAIASNFQYITTAGSSDPAGGKTFTFYASAAKAANQYAEGLLWSQSGTAANLGQIYRVKSHAAIGAASTGTLYLYDSLRLVPNTADLWSIQGNPYKLVTQNSAGAQLSVGVMNVNATTNDYLWIQTWGPCAVKSFVATGLVGGPFYATTTGTVVGYTGTDSQPIL